MLSPLHPGSHNNLQLGEGVLMRCADLDALLTGDDPAAALAQAIEKASGLLGATKEGCVFRCVPVMIDATKGARTPADGETLQGRWEITLSGTLMEITPDNAALLLGSPLYTTAGRRTTLTPRPDAIPTAGEDVCWVGDTGSGLLAIQLFCPISIGGMVFRAHRNGLGEAAFTLMAQKRDPAEERLPCRMIWLREAMA